jgi:hypothetical protein
MANRIFGVVRDAAGGDAPVKGLRIHAWDKDWPDGDDFMGKAFTDANGRYEISFQAREWDHSIGGLREWLPDIYITVENKNASGRWAHIVTSKVHKNQDLNQDLRIDLEVPFGPPASKRTGFLPETHGFHFINRFDVEPDILGIDLGEWKGMGFCGGMCSGAVYRYRRGIPVPPLEKAPPDGDPLHTELLKRQIAAMSPKMLPTMFDWQSAPDVPTPMRKPSIAERTRDEWPKLQKALDEEGPTILVLIRAAGYLGNPTSNHQVLAIGYDFDPATKDLVIHTYDPNKPDATHTLSLNVGLPDGKLYLKDSAYSRTRGFFVNPVAEEAIQLEAL